MARAPGAGLVLPPSTFVPPRRVQVGGEQLLVAQKRYVRPGNQRSTSYPVVIGVIQSDKAGQYKRSRGEKAAGTTIIPVSMDSAARLNVRQAIRKAGFNGIARFCDDGTL